MGPVGIPVYILRFGLFEADPAAGTLTRNGVRVKIQEQPFRVLILLLERPAEVITRDELRQKLWPEGTFVDFDGSLNVILKRLRAAIDDNSDNPRFIETIPRRGYRFIAPVSTSQKPDPIGAPMPAAAPSLAMEPLPAKETVVAGPTAIARPVPRTPLLLGVVAAVLLTVIGGLLLLRQHSQATGTQPSPASAPVPVRKSVAVLGFHSLSGRAEDAWLGTALAEMLSTELAGGEKLRLVSGEDVANLRISSPWSQTDTLDQGTAAHVGNALGSDLLVLGSYTMIGNSEHGQIRIDVRMQDARTGEIQTEMAEIGSSQDLFKLISRVGTKLREQIGVPPLEDTDEAGILASLPMDREAARFYSLGLARLRSYDALAAKDLLSQATDAEPKFSLSHAMLARSLASLGYEQKRREESKRAVDLASALPRSERLLVQGDYYASLGDYEKAASTYRTLFELFPDSVDYGLQLASAQRMAGHGSEALATIARLRQLPPPASADPNIDLVEARIVHRKEDSLKLIHTALAKASAQGKKLVYAQGRHDECITLVYGEHPRDAAAPCQEAYETFLAAGNRLAAADALRLIADRQEAEGHTDESLATYNRAADMLRALGDHEKTGAVLNNMGSTLMNHGKLDAAEPLFKEAKFHFEQAGDQDNALTPASNLADLAYLRGQLAAAEHLYEQALQMMDGMDTGDPSYLLFRLGDLQLTLGKLKEARQHVEKAVSSLHGEEAEPLSSALIVSGELSKAEGNLSAAREAFNHSLKIRQTLGDTNLIAETQAELADLALEEGHPVPAEQQIRQAIAQFEKTNSSPDVVSGYASLSRALLMQGNLDQARQAAQHAVEMSRDTSDPSLKMLTTVQTARVDVAGNDPRAVNAAQQQLRSTIATAKRLGYYNLEIEARLVLGESELKGKPASGRTTLTTLASEAHATGFEQIAHAAQKALADGEPVTSLTPQPH